MIDKTKEKNKSNKQKITQVVISILHQASKSRMEYNAGGVW
jgi:hypothetical protein